MKTAYHATETRNSEQILRGGLEADLPLADQSLPCGVYLFSVLTDAEDYAALNFDEWTILAVNVDGGAYTAMQWKGGVGAANWGWYTPGRMPVGNHNYNFKITATPALYQADGIYTLDPQVVVVPDL